MTSEDAGPERLISRRAWLLGLLIWAVAVVLGFTLWNSGAGFGALVGGAAGMLGAYLAITFMHRRRTTSRRPR
ncbi:hypothetical protein E9529_15300 [Blastococcus sp. KM273128]|uniref:hypothetical protein n=1 Tax=Blastococcus sp. KM273128 TaxID=2570314 RepID=UPI001F1FE63A|nr:hypothetical protein [Blastococcus sp. KM273128]MCF6745614.1 hypothetical protein [Blastococcus sp. KM273128]